MKKKELIQLIKDKAKEVDVKDFSKEIIEKAKSLPDTYQAPRKRSFVFRPIFQWSIVTFAGVIMMLFLIQPQTPTYAFEQKDYVFIDSAITSLSYLEYELEELSSLQPQTMSSSSLLNHSVEDNLDGILHFASLSERLLKPMTIQTITTHPHYQTQLIFNVEDLLGEKLGFEILYNETKTKKNHYRYEGIIKHDDMTFQFQAVTELGKTHRMHFELSYQNQMIEVVYQTRGTSYVYQFKAYQNQVLHHVFDMIRMRTSDQESILVSFKQNQITGTYTFRYDQYNNRMEAMYFIARTEQRDEEEGVLIITPQAHAMYHIEIRPQGGIPSFVERQRPGNPFQGSERPGNRPF